MQSMKKGKPVVRLSEQEGLDCNFASKDCDGGWYTDYWDMSKKIGSQSNADYPYENRSD